MGMFHSDCAYDSPRGLGRGSYKYNDAELDLLARLMRAEAEGDGQLGMLLVGNVGVNRVRSDCLDFNDIRSLQDMVFQNPGGFEATTKTYFYQSAREMDRNLARRVVNGERFTPGERSLWFFMPREIARLSGITNGTQEDSNHIVSIHQRFKTARKCNLKEERMKKWSNTIGIRPIRISMLHRRK